MPLPFRLCAFPNDARGRAFRTLLGTKCAAPSCPSPHRGYQTVISENVLCFTQSPRPGRLETSPSGGPVEPNPLLFGFYPWTFCRNVADATPLDLSTCRRSPFRPSGSTPDVVGSLRSLGLHRGPLSRRPGWGPTLLPCYQGLSLSWAMPQGTLSSGSILYRMQSQGPRTLQALAQTIQRLPPDAIGSRWMVRANAEPQGG